MKLRTLLFWPHLMAGVLSGALILVMSVTGVLLTYERQLVEWSNSDLKSSISPSSPSRLPLEQVVASFQQARPDLTPSSVVVGSDAGDAVVVSAGPRAFYLDAYTGRLLGEGRQGVRQFMSDVRAWHRWLAAEGEARDDRAGGHRLVEPAVPLHRVFRPLPVVPAQVGVAARAPGGLVHGRCARQGAGLQLAQRHRRVVPGAAVHRRARAPSRFVPVGQRLGVSRRRRDAASRSSRRRTW